MNEVKPHYLRFYSAWGGFNSSISSISDTVINIGAGHFEENCNRESVIAKDITVALLKELAFKQ